MLGEEARNPRRTIPAATYTALAAIGALYAAAAWAMQAHAGPGHVAAAAAAQGPGLLYGLSSSGALAQAAQVLFITSLFAAALSYHNVTWRYMFALSREGVLPAALSADQPVPRSPGPLSLAAERQCPRGHRHLRRGAVAGDERAVLRRRRRWRPRGDDLACAQPRPP